MEPTIKELNESLNKLMSEPDPPLRPDPRESYPEIKTPLAQSVKAAALNVIEKRNDAPEWKNSFAISGGVFDHRDGGVGETINGLEINVFQRKDSSLSIEIFDEGYSDANLNDWDNSSMELHFMDTNSRGEVVSFAKDHSIFERMGLNRDEFAQLVVERLEGMASKVEVQSVIQENTLETGSVQVAIERSATDLLTNVSTEAAQIEAVESVQETSVAVANSSTWIEALKSQINNIDGDKVQIFSGKNKVYEQTDNVVTLDKLENALGEKVQQALENPDELKGSVRIMVDGEKIYHAKDGEVVENRHSLTLDNLQVAQSKSLDIVPEVPQVVEAQEQNLQVTQSKSLEVEVYPVAEVQNPNLQATQEKSLDIVPEVPQIVEAYEPNLQVPLPIPEPNQSISPIQTEVSFVPPPEIVVTVTNEQIKSPTQAAQPISFESNEKAIFELIARQDARINQLEQKLAAQSEPLNVKVNQWLGAINQTAKSAVQQVKQKSLHIPQNVRSFIASKANEIKTSISEQVKTTRTHVVNKVNESVTAARTEVKSKVNEVKSSLERKLADVAGTSLNAGTRYLAERFGVDNGSGIKVFQGNSLVITSSNEHSGIYSKDGKQLVKDGQFTSPVTSEQLSKIAQVSTEAQKLSQSQSAVRAKALR